MKKRKNTPKPPVLQEGFYLDKYFENYEDLKESAKNWDFSCTYQLRPSAISGRHRILQLTTMQLGYAVRAGGRMSDIYSVKDYISVCVIKDCQDKACFHRTKLHTGDIIFFDDSGSYNFLSNEEITFVVVNIPTKMFQSIWPDLSSIVHHSIKDSNDVFFNLVHQLWDRLANDSNEKRESKVYQDTEKEILTTIKELLKTQTPWVPKLTKGEESALAIRDQLYLHMDGKINIVSLAKEHNISERTLQISFKSLFGFTPTVFLRNMKLNLVYRDLKFKNLKSGNVSSIAQKWGFMHMGRFSKYYTDLFGENPSATLKTPCIQENIMAEDCVERQEEIT